jgi:hypothetical protein
MSKFEKNATVEFVSHQHKAGKASADDVLAWAQGATHLASVAELLPLSGILGDKLAGAMTALQESIVAAASKAAASKASASAGGEIKIVIRRKDRKYDTKDLDGNQKKVQGKGNMWLQGFGRMPFCIGYGNQYEKLVTWLENGGLKDLRAAIEENRDGLSFTKSDRD